MLKSVTQLHETINLGDSLLPAKWMQIATLAGQRANLGSIEIARIDSSQFKEALRIGSELNFHEENEIRVDVPSAAPVMAGDVIQLRFWFRCADSLCGDGFVVARIFKESDPQNALAELNVSSGIDWTEVILACEVPVSLEIGELILSFEAGFERQVIEIGGVSAENHKDKTPLSTIAVTEVSYPGRTIDASWRELALKRIDQHRKSRIVVTVTDRNGQPVRGAEVHFNQVRQEFGFGSCVEAGLLIGDSFDSEQYRDKVQTMFNRAVFENDMKWYADNEGMSPNVLTAIDWLHEQGISVRGHNMVWPSWRWSPEQLKSLSDDPISLGRRVVSHIHEVGTVYRGRITDWDVVNEPFSNHDLMDVLGGNNVMVDWYKVARQADPTCRLCLNDFGIFEGGRQNPHRDHFYNTIENLLRNGAPIDTIGIQSHFGTNLASPIRVLEVLDQFSSFGLPIESTEISFNLTDRKLQADYLKDYLLALYSHPNVIGAVLWGFWTKRHWRPDAALFNAQWQARPIADAWLEMRKQFSTDAICKTDSTGSAETAGHHGEYLISVRFENRKIQAIANLSKADLPLSLTLS